MRHKSTAGKLVDEEEDRFSEAGPGSLNVDHAMQHETMWTCIAQGGLGLWSWIALVCFAWTAWAHFDDSTVNYGLSRPGFWLDFLAWYTLCLLVIGRFVLGTVRMATDLGKRGRLSICVAGAVFWTVVSVAAWFPGPLDLELSFPCWLKMYGRGGDMGCLIALSESIYPFGMAHYTWTLAEYLKRRSNRSFDQWSEKNATHFAQRQGQSNACTNTIMRDVHRELQHVAPTSSIDGDEDGIYLVAAMYVGLTREGANVELWIDYHLRFGFDYVHLYCDWRDNAWDNTAPYLAPWGSRVRVTKPPQNCSQGCSKRLLAQAYAGTVGWVAWIDADEFIYPFRWRGPLTLRRTLARLRELGYCEIGLTELIFGDSGYPTRPESPLEAYIHTEVQTWPGYGKTITWMAALDPSDGFQHEGRIRKTIPFCKYLKRGSVTQYPNLGSWSLPM
mmetsp:Transcript_55657/g.162739  ORF Transcript_55657/g.162739 Transcript_55657/m.162739 type:complete len:445 (+) Transcript_55657:149-1483(+)